MGDFLQCDEMRAVDDEIVFRECPSFALISKYSDRPAVLRARRIAVRDELRQPHIAIHFSGTRVSASLPCERRPEINRAGET